MQTTYNATQLHLLDKLVALANTWEDYQAGFDCDDITCYYWFTFPTEDTKHLLQVYIDDNGIVTASLEDVEVDPSFGNIRKLITG